MDETPKYRKKKPQQSKSSKRADHKHIYEKSIQIHRNSINHQVSGIYWTSHCAICGRRGDFTIDNDDFKKTEYRGKHLFWHQDMYLPIETILDTYPDIPVYENDSEKFGKDIRVK